MINKRTFIIYREEDNTINCISRRGWRDFNKIKIKYGSSLIKISHEAQHCIKCSFKVHNCYEVKYDKERA